MLSAQKNGVDYIEETITLIKNSSVNKGKVNWKKLSE